MKKSMQKKLLIFSVLSALLFSCQSISEGPVLPERIAPKSLTFHFDLASNWKADSLKNDAHSQILYAINRTDSVHFTKMDTVLIPDDLNGDLAFYMPFPLYVPYLKEVNKIVYFSYSTQSFATYENGILRYTGPTSMGSQANKTPTGLFYTNWKAEQTISTFHDEWELFFNFNIENKEGIGWHQYALPGYPASHSCLRLQEKDAKHLYAWADQWKLENKHVVKKKGTPVIVFGTYNFDAPKPWLKLVKNHKALKISATEVEKQTKAYLKEILEEQSKL
jgi:hypothetical protein